MTAACHSYVSLRQLALKMILNISLKMAYPVRMHFCCIHLFALANRAHLLWRNRLIADKNINNAHFVAIDL